MSDVFRLSKGAREELEMFKKFYLDSFEEFRTKDSQFLNDLYQEKLNYSDSQWIEFAIRIAACKYIPKEGSFSDYLES